MPYRPVRPRSVAAGWSLRLGRFALVLALLALVLHRTGMLAFDTAVAVLGVATVLSLFVAALALIGFVMLWHIGAKGGRAAFFGLVMAAIVLAPAGFAAERYIELPRVREAATNALDLPEWLSPPPETRSFLPEPRLRGENAAAAGIVADPELTGRRYDGAIDRVIPAVRAAAEQRKWREVARDGASAALSDLEDRRVEPGDGEDGPSGASGDPAAAVPGTVPVPEARPDGEAEPIFADGGLVTLQYTAKTLVLGIEQDVVIRLSEEEETTFVDMRAATRYGPHDLGLNAALIHDFLHDLDQRLLGIAGS